MGQKILLLEDDFFLRDGLCVLLEKEGYTVQSARDCAEARALMGKSCFDLAILDVMLPDGSGLEICQELRLSGNPVPILFLTACDEEYQIVRGLDAGADDYVTKPFKMLEFLSRVRALLRRNPGTTIREKDLSVDMRTMRVTSGNREIPLTPTEFQLLTTLISNRGSVVTRNALLQHIWDCDGNFIDDNTLSVHISRLREKIGAEHIATVRGAGYRWEE